MGAAEGPGVSSKDTSKHWTDRPLLRIRPARDAAFFIGTFAALGLAWVFRAVTVPLLLAFLCAVLVDPLVRKLESLGVPRWLSAVGALLALIGIGTTLITVGLPPLLDELRLAMFVYFTVRFPRTRRIEELFRPETAEHARAAVTRRQEVREAILTGAVNHRVRLGANGCQKAQARREGDRDEQHAWRNPERVRRRNCHRGKESRGRLIRDEISPSS